MGDNLKDPVSHAVIQREGKEVVLMERRLVNLRVEYMGDHTLVWFLNPATNQDYPDMPPYRVDKDKTMLMQFALPLRPTQVHS